MKVNPINTNYNMGKKPAFKAVLLKDNILFTDKQTHSPIKGAIVELETETREMIADSRRKHEHDISEEEYKKRIGMIWSDGRQYVMDDLTMLRDKEGHYLGRDLYWGDYKLMDELVRYNELPFIKEINGRVKERDVYNRPVSEGNVTTTREYWRAVTAGQTNLSPEGYEGLLDKSLYNYLWRFGDAPQDSMIYGNVYKMNADAPHKKILLAVEHQNDGNYRDMSASKVLGIAEIYTDRAMDVVEEMAADDEKRIEQLKTADAEYDKLSKKWSEMEKGPERDELNRKLNRMAQDICVKYGVSMSDFMYVEYGKSYLKSNEQIGKDTMRRAKLYADRVVPVNAFLISTFNHLKGVGDALINAICEKGRYCGVYADLGGSGAYNLFYRNGFKHIAGMKENKLFKPGFLKPIFK